MNYPLKLSLNTQLRDKIEPTERRFFAEDFQPCEITLSELEDAVQEGIAFSYQFEHSYMRSEFFLASDILAIDIDGGLSVTDALLLGNSPILVMNEKTAEAGHVFKKTRTLLGIN